MKILFLIPRFYPEIGGVEKHCYMVMSRLSRLGFQVTSITSTKDKKLTNIEKVHDFKIYRIFINNWGDKVSFLINLFKIWAFLLKNFDLFLRNDIVHLHDYQTFLWLFPLLPFIRKPKFITFHGFESYPIPVHSKFIRKIAAQILDGSLSVGGFINKWYGTKSEYVTLGGTDNMNNTFTGEKNSAVFIGRLAVDTGILDLINALKILKGKYGITLTLHICGSGPLYKEIKEKSKKWGLPVHMHGFVVNPENYIISCSYAFTSGYLSILECMAYKRPVFTLYNNPLKKDYLYSFPNADHLMIIASSPEDLAEKIYTSINDSYQLGYLIEQAYKFACKNTWDRVALIYLQLYGGGLNS